MNNASIKNIAKEIHEGGISLKDLETEIQRLKQEEKKKNEREELITRRRKEMIAAVANYVEAVNPEIKFNKEDLDELEKDMADMTLFKFKTRKDLLHDDDIILKFLKSLGR